MLSKPHGMVRRASAALMLVALVLVSSGVPAQAQIDAAAARTQPIGLGKTSYRVVNLSDGEHYGSVAINASGQVAFSYTADLFQIPISAFFYDGARIRNIGRLGNDYAVATGLNDSGQVVGQSFNAEGSDRTFVWSMRRPMFDIGLLPGTRYVYDPLINNRGVVAGFMSGSDGNHAYRWSQRDGFTDLGALAQSPPRAVTTRALNDAGMITGVSRTGFSGFHAYRWTFGSGMVDIHTLDVSDSAAVGIDASGNIAGNYYDQPAGDAIWRAFVWTPRGGMRALVNGTDDVSVIGITPSGRVFGSLSRSRDYFRAYTWTRAGGIVALGSLGGLGSMPSGANNKGQVVGNAIDTLSQSRAFAWSAAYGMVDLNTRLRHAPPSLELYDALAISDNGAILARANSGLVLLKPANGAPCTCPHTVGPIMARDLTLPGAPFEAAVGIASDQPGARYKIAWSWGDGATANGSAQAQAEPNARAGAKPAVGQFGNDVMRASARHTFTAPGVYTVSANVVDVSSGAAVRVSRKIVVQAAQGVAGAGAFFSHTTAGENGAQRTGRASFAFIAPSPDALRSNPDASATRAALHFRAGDLAFRSTDIAPVAVARGRGQFAGSGAINGKGAYRFDLVTLAPTPDAPARFGLKIWHTDAATGAQVLDYDNQASGDRRVARAVATNGIATAAAIAADAVGSALTEGSIALE